jgi:hypothetical protein
MRVSLETESYTVEPFSDNELISGRPGSYYIVDLKASTGRGVWQFGLGDYTVEAFDRDFGRSLVAFVRDIVRPVEKEADYALFVRGSADRDIGSDFKREQKKGFQYKAARYFPSVDQDRYISTAKIREIPIMYTNEDLPFLRAVFMQERLSTEVYGLKEPVILEGIVNKADEDERLRNATVFLFVKWPPRKKVGGNNT